MEDSMALRLSTLSLASLLVVTSTLKGNPLAAGGDSTPASPALINTCLITNDVARLVEFYHEVLRITPKTASPEYAEFPTGVGVLAIFSAKAQEQYIPHSTEPASNRSAILEFKVDDVDKEYVRLKSLVKAWVKGPTNQPWGTRSIYFRDPDGNLVDFFAVVKPQ
jgi:catechol 2,3-dioxygenase-like lactoylglutathione lyase family enzyme